MKRSFKFKTEFLAERLEAYAQPFPEECAELHLPIEKRSMKHLENSEIILIIIFSRFAITCIRPWKWDNPTPRVLLEEKYLKALKEAIPSLQRFSWGELSHIIKNPSKLQNELDAIVRDIYRIIHYT